jgi:hypothetical protein
MVDLFTPIIIERHITSLVYIWSGSCLILFTLILWRLGHLKRALTLIGVSFFINLGWEVSLLINHARVYESSYYFILELIYHSFTEFAPFVLFWAICLHLSRYIRPKAQGTSENARKNEKVDEGEKGAD